MPEKEKERLDGQNYDLSIIGVSLLPFPPRSDVHQPIVSQTLERKDDDEEKGNKND